jgi:hypothetical protein
VKAPPRDFSTVRAGFEAYRRFIMPPDAGDVQIIECRRAFYAGAVQVFFAVIDNANLPEAEAMQRLSDYQAELAAFAESIKNGEA